jgi:hypothetical protein
MFIKALSSIALLSLAFACGQDPTVVRGIGSQDCDSLSKFSLAAQANCQTGTAAPTPTPVPTVGLVFSGDLPSPPPSSFTNQGSVRVPSGTPSSWQLLGVNNQPAVTKTVGTTMTQAGQCRPVDVKVQVSNGGANNGTYYISTNGNRFRVCQDGDKVTVEFEDGVDSLFNDYKISIASTTGQPVTFTWVGNQLNICLD